MGRVKFITQAGKEILAIDMSQCDALAFRAVAAEAQPLVAKHGTKSLLTLTNLTGVGLDADTRDAIREFIAENKPFVKASALYGVSGIARAVGGALIAATGRRMKIFDSEGEALAWLATQD